MKLISVTNLQGKVIFININHIGHIFEGKEYTVIGVTTHNNGGFQVKESAEDIITKISSLG